LGSIVTSRPIAVSWQSHTVAGSIRVAPFSITLRRSRACITASASASSTRELTPSASSAGASTTGRQAGAARGGDNIVR